jgi:hypothetical protein
MCAPDREFGATGRSVTGSRGRDVEASVVSENSSARAAIADCCTASGAALVTVGAWRLVALAARLWKAHDDPWHEADSGVFFDDTCCCFQTSASK